MADRLNSAFRQIKVKTKDGIEDQVLSSVPSICLYCKQQIRPILLDAVSNSPQTIQVIFQCPNPKCNEIFVEHYKDSGLLDHYFNLVEEIRPFDKNINDTSLSFVSMYYQSQYAKKLKLFDVCGTGFKKALEFLIKDYLIQLTPERKPQIAKKFLADCIKEIKDENIQIIANRATWLANDQSHYAKDWEGKNLDDLLELVDFVVDWIGRDIRARKLKIEMPHRKIK